MVTSPVALTTARCAPRVLVDGLDLSGKTTLVRAIVAALAERGVPAMPHRGMLAGHHPLEQWLRRTFPLVRQPDSGIVTAAFLLAGFALDRVLVTIAPPRPAGTVLVQDGYADRAVAAGMAGGPYLAACLALRWPGVFASFDIAVYLHAPDHARAARLAGRPDADVNDVRSARDACYAATFTAMLVNGMGRRHRRLLVFDTSVHSPEEMASAVTALLFPARVPGPRQPLPGSLTGQGA
jgi:thymidylate kinase